MQTTLRIDDRLYRRAKVQSSQLGLSLTRFLEEALEERLDHLESKPVAPIRLPVSSAVGKPVKQAVLQRRIARAELGDDLKRAS
jgi:hypothetical protein